MELSLQDLHGALNVRRGVVQMILAENHPAGLGIPRILVVKPLAVIFHDKRQAHDIIALVLVFLLVSEIGHGVHQMRRTQIIQTEGATIRLRAARATGGVRGAPDHAAGLAGDEVGGDAGAGDCDWVFHCLLQSGRWLLDKGTPFSILWRRKRTT